MTEIAASSFEDALDQVLAVEASLTEEQRSQLSKVLFPDTHTDEVDFAGAQRTLRPLTIKFSRRLDSALLPFHEKVRKAAEAEIPFQVDQDIVDALYIAVGILSEFYGWSDVLKKIAEEDVLLEELQILVVQQQHLQGDNDFLLGPLRVLIKFMQTLEILQRRIVPLTRNSSDTLPS